jgi:hypothetical protein
MQPTHALLWGLPPLQLPLYNRTGVRPKWSLYSNNVLIHSFCSHFTFSVDYDGFYSLCDTSNDAVRRTETTRVCRPCVVNPMACRRFTFHHGLSQIVGVMMSGRGVYSDFVLFIYL